MLPSQGEHELAWADVITFLSRRQVLLDAVVFSGGEPTGQPALAAAMQEVKSLGFKVGLHTAGICPKRLAAALPFVDWVGMDVKAPFDDYARVTRICGSGIRARQSALAVLASGVDYQFRTTVDATVLTQDDLNRIADDLTALGARNHVLQECRSV